MSAGCEIPFVKHGEVVIVEDGWKSVTRCYEGYYHLSGDLVRLCNGTNARWDGLAPLCDLLPGLSSIQIMFLIGGPILLFFAVCLPIDYYYFIKRKQGMREQQGMVYYRELRRVGMTRAGGTVSVDELEYPRNTGAIGSVRRNVMRIRSLLGVMSLKRKVSGRRGADLPHSPPGFRRSLSEPSQDAIHEVDNDDSSINTAQNSRPITGDVSKSPNSVYVGNEPVVVQVSPMPYPQDWNIASKAKLSPITQVYMAENKRHLYSTKRSSQLNLISSARSSEPIPAATADTYNSVHV